MKLIREFEAKFTKPSVPKFNVGDGVDVEVRIKEGDKERVQLFSGVVIQIRGSGIRTMFTVRRIVQGEGVERVFPLHSPKIANVIVRRAGRVRRSKLFYLRGRTGRAARIEEKARVVKDKGDKGDKGEADPS